MSVFTERDGAIVMCVCVCCVQRILADYHAQRMHVLTQAAPAEETADALQLHKLAQATPIDTGFGTMELASEAEAIDAEEMGAEFAGGVQFVAES
jgi:hypothetical protein